MTSRRFLSVTLLLVLIAVLIVLITISLRVRPHHAPAPATAVPTFTPAHVSTTTPVQPTATPASDAMMTDDNRSPKLKRLTNDWQTDWTRHTIRYDEILSGGPPRDGIPSIDHPKFVSPKEASAWLKDNEPVIALEVNGVARAYPIQIVIWHEIVNDVIGGVPVAVTFCPLCNSAIVFDRRLDAQVFEFGVSGLLRNSDLIMYDRSTESLWQQFTGEGIVGKMAGAELTWLPASLISYADFRQTYPDGQVLSRETGFGRSYGSNPYVGYDNIEETPFLFDGIPDDRLPPMARVVTVSIGDQHVAYPYAVLVRKNVIADHVAGQDVVVFYEPGTASALDARTIADSRDVGATNVFDPVLDGQRLSFRREGDHFVDDQTGSNWNILGVATSGPLAGKHLTPVIHADHFWFSWAAFRPDTRIYHD